MQNQKSIGHLLAGITIFIWGTTFIATKILLQTFLPIEILFLRFVLGFFALLLADWHHLHGATVKQHLVFAAAGFCGVTLYYLLENIALTDTLASNVGVIISASPFFTVIFSRIGGKIRLNVLFFIGFVIAFCGIGLIRLGDGFSLHPVGDLLALLAALAWSAYSLLTHKIASYGYPVIQTTRIVFLYGLLFMLPVLPWMGFRFALVRLLQPVYALNLLFLGLGASALCFLTWGCAVKILGAVKTSIYIYMVPAVTVIASVLILHEPFTIRTACGVGFTLAGLLISERGQTAR